MNNNAKQRSCATCVYAEPDPTLKSNLVGAPQNLRCMRFPPVTAMIPTQQGMAVNTTFPIVNHNIWCYEWDDHVRQESIFPLLRHPVLPVGGGK